MIAVFQLLDVIVCIWTVLRVYVLVPHVHMAGMSLSRTALAIWSRLGADVSID